MANELNQQELEHSINDALTSGVGIMQGNRRIDPASIYKDEEDLKAEAAFNRFADGYDTYGDKWQDMGADRYFIEGWKAAKKDMLKNGD